MEVQLLWQILEQEMQPSAANQSSSWSSCLKTCTTNCAVRPLHLFMYRWLMSAARQQPLPDGLQIIHIVVKQAIPSKPNMCDCSLYWYVANC